MSNIFLKIINMLNGPITPYPEVWSTDPAVQDALRSSGETTPMGNFFVMAIRTISSYFDRAVAGAIDGIFTFLQTLADIDIFGHDVIEVFATRVYVLIALFMLFKLSFVLIKYLLDPEQFASKDAGFSKMVSKAMIALVLLVLVPFMFSIVFNLQGVILRNQVLEKVIFGVETELANTHSKVISYATYAPFNSPNRELVGDSCSGNDLDECLGKLAEVVDPKEGARVLGTYKMAVDEQDAQLLLSPTLINATTTDNKFIFNYGIPLNFFAGIVVFLIILSFCFDVAIRSVKLGFLQLIAPIPIIASIEPKSDIFSKWLKTTITTFFDLFIRLSAIYFALFIITITNNQLYSFSTQSQVEGSGWLRFFILMGALLFAKQMPKLITDITGLKMDGSFSLNPMSRLSQVPAVGKLGSALVGGVGGAVAGGIAGAASGNVRLGALHGAGTGLQSGAKDTSWAGAKDAKDPHAFSAGFKGAYKNISGKEYSILSSERIHGMMNEDLVKSQLAEPKNNIKMAKERMTELSYNSKVLDKLYGDAGKGYATAKDPEAKSKYKSEMMDLQSKMKANASAQKKYEDIIEVNKDRIKDIESFWDYDKSSKKSYSKTMYKDQDNIGEDFQKAEEEFKRVIGEDFSRNYDDDDFGGSTPPPNSSSGGTSAPPPRNSGGSGPSTPPSSNSSVSTPGGNRMNVQGGTERDSGIWTP